MTYIEQKLDQKHTRRNVQTRSLDGNENCKENCRESADGTEYATRHDSNFWNNGYNGTIIVRMRISNENTTIID